jgi:hypothetical protein
MTMMLLMAVAVSGIAHAADDEAKNSPAIRVAQVIYQPNQRTDCFGTAFLAQVDRQTSLRVAHKLDTVELASDKLFDYPLVVLWGKGAFTLSEKQMKNLTRYLQRGGTILATTMCGDEGWDASFRKVMTEALPKTPLAELPADHALFSTLYKIPKVRTIKPAAEPLLGATVRGRLTVLYSPVDLRDAYNLTPDCCCCGANEVRNAMSINANYLVYAATR